MHHNTPHQNIYHRRNSEYFPGFLVQELQAVNMKRVHRGCLVRKTSRKYKGACRKTTLHNLSRTIDRLLNETYSIPSTSSNRLMLSIKLLEYTMRATFMNGCHDFVHQPFWLNKISGSMLLERAIPKF